eukprot:298499-Alexandrium_andersonii.AAC.1
MTPPVLGDRLGIPTYEPRSSPRYQIQHRALDGLTGAAPTPRAERRAGIGKGTRQHQQFALGALRS